jgi:WhiB family redox-sensing transcriptional regulator
MTTGALHGLVNGEPWTDQALCAQVDVGDIFYPEVGQGTVKVAKSICLGCPVRELCLEYALKRSEPHGIWGGTTPRERRRMRPNMRWSPITHCINGHEYAKTGRRADLSCAQCRRNASQRSKKRGAA